MSEKIQLLVPKETTNIIRNPSVELNLEDWAAIGSGISRSPNEGRFGWNAVRVFTNDLDDNEGVYVRSFPNTLDTIYTGSIYVKGQGRVRLRMRDGTNGLDFPGEFVNLETDPELEVPACEPNNLVFDGADSIVNCGDTAPIQNLQDDAFTAEAWIRARSLGESNAGRILNKGDEAATGWGLWIEATGLQGRVRAPTSGISVSGAAALAPDNEWHHVVMTFDDAGTRFVRLFIDGNEPNYTTHTAALGLIVSDVGRDLIIGNFPAVNRTFDGDIGWCRISDNLRYTENFTPPGRCQLPDIDAHTIAQWIGVEQDGELSLVENQEGDANLDGTEANTEIGCACSDPERGKKWRRLSVVGKVGVAQTVQPLPNYLEFNGDTSEVDCGDNAAIQDLAASTITIESWINPDNLGEVNAGRIITKGGESVIGWDFWVAANGLNAEIQCVTQDALSTSGADEFVPDGEWHHVAMTFDGTALPAGNPVIQLWIDGVEVASYTVQNPGQGAIVSDVGSDLTIGNYPTGIPCFDGGIGWCRISDSLRYTAGFTPPNQCILPIIDGNTVGQWIGTETNPAVVDNQEGDANLDGVGANVTINATCLPSELPSNDLRLIVETDEVQEAVFYVDGAQIEEGELTTYCDGDQPGCRWNGTFHDSTSQRNNPEFREGGLIRSIPMLDPDLYVTISSGLGMPPIRQIFQELAILPGSVFERSKALSRTVDLTFWARNPLNGQPCFPASIDRLNEIRQALIDVIKPDVVKDQQPFVLFYVAEQGTVHTSVRYDSGLEFTGDLRNPYFNNFNMRVIAESPFWNEDDQSVRILEQSQALTPLGVLARIEGEWQALAEGPIPTPEVIIHDMEVAPNGDVYACGSFTDIGGVPFNRIARWDGENWNALGVGLDANTKGIAISPAGTVYVCGDFSNAGGAPALRVAQWNPVTETWSAMGAGLNSNAEMIIVDHVGDVYVTGDFTTADGNPAARIARWDGAMWHPLGSGLNVIGRDLAVHPNGSLYVCGNFTTADGVTVNRVARWVLADNAFTALGDGLDDEARGILITDEGTVYICGSFIVAGSTTVNRITSWNGTDYFALGEGLVGSEVTTLEFSPNNELFVGGLITSVDGEVVGFDVNVALWNGSVWTIPDFISGLQNVFTPGAMLFVGHDFYLGGTFRASFDTAIAQDIVNPGSASIFPQFKFIGPGRLLRLESLSTDDVIYFDYTALEGEEVIIDMRENIKTVSSNFRGNVISAVLPNSDFAKFSLLPGTNRIQLFITDEVAETQFQISFGNRHWSFDGVAA